MQDERWVGKYRLIAKLGRGGTSEVFLAVARGPGGFNKLVALKQVRPEYADDPEFRTMFLDEARLAARLNHPNVIQTNEVDEDGGRIFLTMEYLEGQSLARILRRTEGAFPLALHLGALVEALGGLHHAHELADYDGEALEVVHRDASPHNVYVTYDGRVKLMDFGIAKALDSASVTRAGLLKGRLGYMAPEQIRGEPLDRRADIFAVGVMIWEAATGARMWKEAGDRDVMARLLAGEIPPLRGVRPGVPPKLEAVCMKALSPDRAKRFATAAELGSALEEVLAAIGPNAPSMRDAGARIAQAFATEREEVRRVVEEQLRGARTLLADEKRTDLPIVDLTTVTGSTSLNEPPTLPNTAQKRRSPDPPDLGSETVVETSPSSVMRPSAVLPPSLRVWKRAADSRRSIVYLMLIAASAAAVVVGVALRALAPSRLAAPPPSAIAPTPVDSAPHAPAEIEVRVRTSPAAARVLLDDHAMGTSPWTGRFPRDGTTHALRVEASGFVSRARDVTFDKDLELELELAAEREPERADGKREEAPPSGAPAVTPAKGRPQRELDTTNPYAN